MRIIRIAPARASWVTGFLTALRRPGRIDRVIWIISGPTNAGKSTFIRSPTCFALTGLPVDAPVIFPFASTRLPTPDDPGALYHYNILRTADTQHPRGRGDALLAPMPDSYVDFDQDPKWRELVSVPTAKAAIVLVVDRRTLLERAAKRQIIECSKATGGVDVPYPNEHWLDLLACIDLTRVYQAWCAELQRHDIGWVLLDSRGDSYPHLSPDALRTLESP